MSLFENLIIMAMIVVVLYSALLAENLALRRLHILYYKEIALEQAQALMERFRTVPSAETMSQEQTKFEETLSYLLPQAHSENLCNYGQHECSITIYWQDHGDQTANLKSLI